MMMTSSFNDSKLTRMSNFMNQSNGLQLNFQDQNKTFTIEKKVIKPAQRRLPVLTPRFNNKSMMGTHSMKKDEID
jgi:hypothetical protein